MAINVDNKDANIQQQNIGENQEINNHYGDSNPWDVVRADTEDAELLEHVDAIEAELAKPEESRVASVFEKASAVFKSKQFQKGLEVAGRLVPEPAGLLFRAASEIAGASEEAVK